MGKRKTVVCRKCNKEKVHFGLGMCSPCLRKTKRETRPSFYLGTCYSEISRRVKTKDKLRPIYYGLEKCSREEFIKTFEEDPQFLRLYENWQKSGFQRKESPSIDRIDNTKGYILGNIEFIRHGDNSSKDKKKPITLYKNGIKLGEFDSLQSAAKFIGADTSTVWGWYHGRCKSVEGYEVEDL